MNDASAARAQGVDHGHVVLRQVNSRDATRAQLPLQAVAVAKGFGEPGRDVAHDYRNPIRATS
jgi:hypothetical protein